MLNLYPKSSEKKIHLLFNLGMMMKKILLPLVMTVAAATTSTALAETPVLTSAMFDSSGKLHVKATHPGEEGCYLSVLGGLNSSDIDTVIKSIQISASQAKANRVTIKTLKKYYCRKRTLYVRLESVCLGDQVSDELSNIAIVKVPNGNLKK